MPLPFLAYAAIATGVAGLVKGGKAIADNNEAKNIIEEAQELFNNAKDSLEQQKNTTAEELESLGAIMLESWSRDIGSFLPLFRTFKRVDVENKGNINKQLKLASFDHRTLKNMKIASMKATEVVGAGVGALGAGALAGVASYGGAMMFASASTGTAIATLSGAAATNATLAWFGGGSLAAGGLGVAGGTVVLGGVVAAPVIAVAGFIMAAKAEENLAKAKNSYAEAENAKVKMETMESVLSTIENLSIMDGQFIQAFSFQYQKVLQKLSEVKDYALEVQKNTLGNRIRRLFGLNMKVDYRKLGDSDKGILHKAWLMTQILYSTLTTPILNEQGDLNVQAESRILELQSESTKYLEA